MVKTTEIRRETILKKLYYVDIFLNLNLVSLLLLLSDNPLRNQFLL